VDVRVEHGRWNAGVLDELARATMPNGLSFRPHAEERARFSRARVSKHGAATDLAPMEIYDGERNANNKMSL
jgi:hypothetical protein